MRTFIELPPEPRAARDARQFVADRLQGRADAETVDVILLLTSEVVTNAVVHAGTPLRLDLDVVANVVHVAVADGAPNVPRQRDSRSEAVTGRGLHLVSALASEWGVEPHPAGKAVWFEVPCGG